MPEHFYQPIAEFLDTAYLRNAFTMGTTQEVDFLAPRLDRGRRRLLDAGCGPGRHSLEFARHGWDVEGIDISPRFVELAREAADSEGLSCRFELGDLRLLEADAEYDAVVCLCQGGFGLVGGGIDGDLEILRRLRRALVPGGRLALSAFNAFFAVTILGEEETFDPDTGLHHEVAELRNPEGEIRVERLATACYTPRELRAFALLADLEVEGLWGVEPGDYAERPPSLELPEYLLMARRPG